MKLKVMLICALLSLSTLALGQVDVGRESACSREDYALLEAISALKNGSPIGTIIFDGTTLGDPRYAGGTWVKYSYTRIDRSTNVTTDPGYLTRYRIEIHYMYNTVTKAFEQLKLKNTAQEGCVGQRIRTTVGNYLDGVAAPVSGVGSSWYIQGYWRDGYVDVGNGPEYAGSVFVLSSATVVSGCPPSKPCPRPN
jgi:hypothetical protein